jgi:short-subunit dehydrogenase
VSQGRRTILVTGASSGIGRAAALQAAEAGDHLVLVARDRPTLDEVARHCQASGAASVLVQYVDVGDDSAVAECFAAAYDRHQQLDAVLHCAGVVAYGRTEEVPVEVFDGVLRTNLHGSVNVARHAIARMRPQERGSIVLVGSLIGHIAVPSMSPYVVSKWGVRALARQLQIENRDLRHLSIAYVAPGGVDTPIYEQGANYSGFVGRPPPPVDSPEHAARVVLKRIDNHRARTQTGLANDFIRFGFSAMPWAYDLLVGPLFRLAASDRTRPVADGPGNVLAPNGAGNGLRGNHDKAVIGIGKNLVAHIGSLAGRRPA